MIGNFVWLTPAKDSGCSGFEFTWIAVIPVELAGKNPRFVQFEHILPHLTEEQFNMPLASAQGMDRANRR